MLDLPGAHESVDSFADRSPPGNGEASSDPRGAPLCWTSQEPTKVATVSQIAARQGRRGLNSDPRSTPLRWTSQEPTEVATVSQIAAHQGW